MHFTRTTDVGDCLLAAARDTHTIYHIPYAADHKANTNSTPFTNTIYQMHRCGALCWAAHCCAGKIRDNKIKMTWFAIIIQIMHHIFPFIVSSVVVFSLCLPCAVPIRLVLSVAMAMKRTREKYMINTCCNWKWCFDYVWSLECSQFSDFFCLRILLLLCFISFGGNCKPI